MPKHKRLKGRHPAVVLAEPLPPKEPGPQDQGLYLFLDQEGGLMARVPAAADQRSSTFKVPSGPKGLDFLYHVLHQRQQGVKGVGTLASPTVSTVEDFLRAGGTITKLAPKGQRPPKRELSLESLGLTGDELIQAMAILGQIK